MGGTGIRLTLREASSVCARSDDQSLTLNQKAPAERTGTRMMNQTTVLITDMSILVGIFLLGFLAKIFPRNGRKHDANH
jgi:hypothetical protein